MSNELMVWMDPLELLELNVDLTVPSDDVNDKDDTLKMCGVDVDDCDAVPETINIQWNPDQSDFEWSKRGWFSNGPDFERDLKF